jgi:hypothetical protein
MGLEETVSECSDKNEPVQLDRSFWRAQGIEACLDRMQLMGDQLHALRSATAPTDPFSRVIDLIESINIDRYGKPLVAALHLCNDLAAELSARSSIGASEEIDDPFCWYIVQRDITDEYSTVYSEAENCPGPGWKPLYERPVVPSATVEIDPRMLMLIRVLDDLEESGNGWNPATMPRSANEAERKFRDMLATNWKDIRRLIPIRASDGGVSNADAAVDSRGHDGDKGE